MHRQFEVLISFSCFSLPVFACTLSLSFCSTAFVFVSSINSRIKIDQFYNNDDTSTSGNDINLSIQFILNCGSEVAGSCNGGSHIGVYKFIHTTGFVPYDTCMPYLACSVDSKYGGFCSAVDTTCADINTCRTCTYKLFGGGSVCSAVPSPFPNATVAEYGSIRLKDDDTDDDDEIAKIVEQIQAEIYVRGPVAASINGKALHSKDYIPGTIFTNTTYSQTTTHVVAIVGWGCTNCDDDDAESTIDMTSSSIDDDDDTKLKYWICRNSWGEYFGEMGFFRIRMGSNVLGIESHIAWAVPGQYSSAAASTKYYTDPSLQYDVATIHQQRRRSLSMK